MFQFSRGYPMQDKAVLRKAMVAAFPHTIPILAAFLFLGLTYGIYMNASGFSFWYPMLISMTVFAGSMEFIVVNLLLGAFNPLQALFLTLMVNSRHLFYGLSMLEKFRGMGRKKPYLIFGLCDETFSINYTSEIPEGVDKGWFMFFVTLFNQLYWVTGATLGGIFGAVIAIDLTGIHFVLPAMFVVIFLEQWLKEDRHLSAWVGFACCIPCLLIFGPENFLIPSMAAMLLVLTMLARTIIRRRLLP